MSGIVWKFADAIDTDVLAPGAYMKSTLQELSRHCLEAVDPTFASHVRPGDVVVAGRNFGIGSSREQAAEALKALGVAAVVAKSFGGIFYRNALNLGLVAVVCPDTDQIAAGARIEVDAKNGVIRLDREPRTIRCEALPGFLFDMVQAGGLVPHLRARLAHAACPVSSEEN
jgi:3-isopropylmalate/(R)-2-methylmalate dehydratase small subunit